MGRYHHLSPAYDSDTDSHESWLFDGPDERLADYARDYLPAALIAKLARAYYQNADKSELLADSRDEFEDDMRALREM